MGKRGWRSSDRVPQERKKKLLGIKELKKRMTKKIRLEMKESHMNLKRDSRAPKLYQITDKNQTK